jgi:hypothetical protein
VPCVAVNSKYKDKILEKNKDVAPFIISTCLCPDLPDEELEEIYFQGSFT